MFILALGMLMAISGAMQIQFPKLVESLKMADKRQWELLGAPAKYDFSKTIGVYIWVLAEGYEELHDDNVVKLGRKAFKKALLAKYLMVTGIFLIVFGFIISLT